MKDVHATGEAQPSKENNQQLTIPDPVSVRPGIIHFRLSVLDTLFFFVTNPTLLLNKKNIETISFKFRRRNHSNGPYQWMHTETLWNCRENFYMAIWIRLHLLFEKCFWFFTAICYADLLVRGPGPEIRIRITKFVNLKHWSSSSKRKEKRTRFLNRHQ